MAQDAMAGVRWAHRGHKVTRDSDDPPLGKRKMCHRPRKSEQERAQDTMAENTMAHHGMSGVRRAHCGHKVTWTSDDPPLESGKCITVSKYRGRAAKPWKGERWTHRGHKATWTSDHLPWEGDKFVTVSGCRDAGEETMDMSTVDTLRARGDIDLGSLSPWEAVSV